MHVLTALITIFSAWLWGDWRNWLRYQSTMLFIATGNLIYNLICADHYLWRFIPESFSNYTITELIYTLIVFPFSTLIYLSKYPEDSWAIKILYNIKWIVIYIVFEYIFMLTHVIIYQHGWAIWHSLIFVILMFPLLRLHHTRPLLGYICAIIMGSIITFSLKITIH